MPIINPGSTRGRSAWLALLALAVCRGGAAAAGRRPIAQTDLPADVLRRACLSVALLASLAAIPSARQTATPGDNLILITLDGARTAEIFGGLDVEILRSTLAKEAKLEDQPVYKRFHAATAQERRQKLMPFFWGELMARHGSIAGNPELKSAVRLTNTHRFSYPGYSEILTGEARDAVIKSNDAIQNPYPTILEGLQTALALPPERAVVFGSWEVFNAIAEHKAGALTVNAGYEAFETPDEEGRDLSRLQFETPTPWNSVRHDAYTFGLAMASLRTQRPRVMYLALGETDDWAHDGRYDRVLETYARNDAYLRELWTWLESQPAYRGRTHILITTDHGRGRTTADWRSHGAKVEGAQEVWMAFISPAFKQRGEWKDHPPMFTNQAAATMAAWLGVDWTEGRPGVGRAIR